MRTQHLLILTGAAVIAVLAALWARSIHEPDHVAGAGALLAPGLEAKLNDVGALSVKGKNGVSVTLQRGADNWTVQEKSGYPADTGKVRKLLIGIAQAKLVEPKTVNPEHYGELGVEDPTAPATPPPAADAGKPPAKAESSGVLLEIQSSAEGQDKLALIVGNSARGATATYVRKVGDTQSWLASGDLSAQADPLSWVDRQIMNVAANRIQQVTIRHPDGQTLVIDKASRDDANYTVHDVPEKREVKYASVGNPLASVLASLRFDDIATLPERDPAPHAPIVIEYRTFDGLVVTAQTYVEGEKHYAHFTAAFDEDLAKRFYVPPAPAATAPPADSTKPDAAAKGAEPATTDGQTPAATPPAAADAQAPVTTPPASTPPAAPAEPDFSAVRTEADTLNKTLQPWVYVIGSYKYDQMNKHVAEMLKDVESKDAAKKGETAKKPGDKKATAKQPVQPPVEEEEPESEE